MPPHCATVSSTRRCHVVLARDVGGDRDAAVVGLRRLLRAAQVGDDDARALGGEPVGDRAADALRRAGDDGDLAVERAHQRTGEKDVGTRMRFCCVWISGWIFARNAFQRVVGLQLRAARSRSAKFS